MMKLLLLLCALVAGDAAQSSIGVHVNLKGHPIPTKFNDTGVVIFNDIGGYHGPADGLICSTNISSPAIVRNWYFPNGTQILRLPSYGEFGTSNCGVNQGGSLYYSGVPKERGKFKCTIAIVGPHPNITIPLYIVDMNITGPNLIWPGEVVIAGDNVEISVNVTTFPEGIPVPYQWLVDGENLPADNSRYRGTQTDTLTILNVQKDHQGSYSCLVAHSPSGINVNSVKLIIVTLEVQVDGGPVPPSTTDRYTLTCTLSGVEPLRDSQPYYVYTWLKDEQPFYNSPSTSAYAFDSLRFADAGEYLCQVFVTFNRRLTRETINATSLPFSLTYQTVVYRIYLIIEGDCQNWITHEMSTKHSDINERIIREIKNQCDQIQVEDDIITTDDRAFKCAKHSRDTVVYNAQLLGNDLTNTSILVSCLDMWIHDKDTDNIVMNKVETVIIKECTGIVDDSNSALDCVTTAPLTPGKVGAITLGIFSVILIAIIVVLIGGIFWYRRRRDYMNLGAGGQRNNND